MILVVMSQAIYTEGRPSPDAEVRHGFLTKEDGSRGNGLEKSRSSFDA